MSIYHVRMLLINRLSLDTLDRLDAKHDRKIERERMQVLRKLASKHGEV